MMDKINHCNLTLESLLEYCTDNNRVCPLPPFWNELWEMLPKKVRVNANWVPSPPLILAAWHETPNMLKMMRLAEHIQWANQHDALDSVASFLQELSEENWHHLKD